MAALDFHGQTVWVTGAGKGIGYATALAFVEAGANVTGFDLAFDGESYPFATETLDVADADQVRDVCSAAAQQHRTTGRAGERRRDPAHGRHRPAERGRLAADLRGQRRRRV
jgi:NAD(P)-dependent dehydrogenase (short-subunit alcohol dehydrogenase family)